MIDTEFFPPPFYSNENIPPIKPSANATTLPQTTKITAVLRNLTKDISNIKNTIHSMQQPVYQQQQRPFHPTFPPRAVYGMVVVVMAKVGGEDEDNNNKNIVNHLTLLNIVTHMEHVNIQVGGAKNHAKDISTKQSSTIKQMGP